MRSSKKKKEKIKSTKIMISFLGKSNTMVVAMIMVMSAALQLIPFSTASMSPASIFVPIKDEVQRGEGLYQLHRNMGSRAFSRPPDSQSQFVKDEDDTFNSENLQDYGIWNPAPVYSGGGRAAPVPHRQ